VVVDNASMGYVACSQPKKVAVLCKDHSACLQGEPEQSFVRCAQHAGFDHRNDINPALPQTLHNRLSDMLVYIVANTTHPSAP
jgi:hypothetical protein